MQGAEVLTRFTADTKDFDSKAKGLNTSISSIAKGVLVATGVTKAMSTAWNMVSRNMDTAINRYDTLQNFPKVMKNFGVSSDEAAKSVNRIADSVLGLPTSLDQAVSGVQNIFMVTKDLKKAEAMFQAVNDSAMVFANGSTEAVDRFIYAYKQALSSGKVMAQDFNQMNEAIPGLMDKVAESMGVTFTELKEGLSNGTISTDQFNAALKKLDTEGVGSMGALRDSAFEATGGIGTAIKNMNSRISAGLAEMIDAVNKGLKEAGLGDIATIFSNIGTTIKNVLVSLAPYITKAVIMLSQFGNWIIKNKDWLGAIIIPLTAFITTFATISKVIAIVKSVSAAIGILNATLLANPIVLIIAAIVGLVAAFIYLWNHCEGFRNFWIGLWNGIVSFVKVAIDTVVSIFNGVIDFVKNNWQGLLLLLANPFAGAFKLLYDNCGAFRNFVNGFVNTIVNKFNDFRNKIRNVFTSIGNFISGVKDIGFNIVKGIGNGITSGITWIKNKIRDFVGNVTEFIKKVFKIGSPSKLMEDEVGQWIPKGIAVGINANTDAVRKSMKNIQSSISDSMSPNFNPSSSMHYSPNVNVYNNVDVRQDPLGQMVNNIKTYSGGAKNDYNYGAGF